MRLRSDLFAPEPKSFKGIKESSAYGPSGEISLADFREVVPPISRERARAALARSRARRAANGTT